MGMVPPRILFPRLKCAQVQVKDEHPLQVVWDQIKIRGMIEEYRKNNPPPYRYGTRIHNEYALKLVHSAQESEQSYRSLMNQMKWLEEMLRQNDPPEWMIALYSSIEEHLL